MQQFLWRFLWTVDMGRQLPGIHQVINELKGESSMAPSDWEGLVNERLYKLLVHAKEKVPYFRRVFQEVDFDPESEDPRKGLERVPILTKNDLQKHAAELISEDANADNLFENATGGSTGVPVKFYQDLKYVTIAKALDSFVRSWWGVRPYDKTALIWGADREFCGLNFKERFYEKRRRIRSYNAFRMTEKTLTQYCRDLVTWRPAYLMGYSSALEAMARCAIKSGIDDLEFCAIRSTAEVLWPSQRQVIEEAFASPVFDFYGSREVNNLAAQCPEGRRMHLISTWRFIEIVDEEGHRVPPGVRGAIAVTDLSNFAMPLIRYRNDDVGMISNKQCQCGRPSPVLEELLGRSTDLIRTPDNEIIHGEFFTHLFYGREDIRRFQVHQVDLNRIVVRYVPAGDPDANFEDSLVERISARVGQKVKVEIVACDQIPLPPSGKHRFTISDVPAF